MITRATLPSPTALLAVAMLLLGVLVPTAAALYTKNDAVVQLDGKTFNQVLATEHPWIVEFYAPWCGHCKSLAPEYKKAAENMRGIVRLGAVDCDQHRDVCGRYGVQGFPTIKAFPAGDKTGQPMDYQGARQGPAIAQFAGNMLPNHVEAVTSASHAGWAESHAGEPQLVLFTEKKATAKLLKALALDFKGTLAIGEVHSSHSDVVADYGVESFPTLVLTDADGTRHTFEGAIKHGALFDWISQFADPQTPEVLGGGSGGKPKAADKPFELKQVASQADFKKHCENWALCFVHFLDPADEAHADRLAMLQRLGESQKKNARVSWVDGTSNPAFAEQFGLASGHPQALIYSPGRKATAIYKRGYEEKPLAEFVDAVLAGTKRVALLDAAPQWAVAKDEL